MNSSKENQNPWIQQFAAAVARSVVYDLVNKEIATTQNSLLGATEFLTKYLMEQPERTGQSRITLSTDKYPTYPISSALLASGISSEQVKRNVVYTICYKDGRVIKTPLDTEQGSEVLLTFAPPNNLVIKKPRVLA